MEGKKETLVVLNDGCIANSDTYFCSFYYKAVKRLLDIENIANASYLYRYTKILSKYYDIYCKLKSDKDLDVAMKDRDDAIIKLLKDSLYYRLMYVYKNGTLYSSAVAFHFRNVYEKDTQIIKRLVKKNLLKICSFGGSSIPDIVAVIKVLKSIALKDGIELDFRITIIDFNEDWKNTCFIVLNCLEEFNEAIWKINFIETKSKMKAWKPEMLKAVQEADVVTMVRFIYNIEAKQKIVEMVCNKLKAQAIFILLDRPIDKLINFYVGMSDVDDLHLIHIELHDYHTLDIEAVKLLRTLYMKHFGNEKFLRSNVACPLFASMWIKASSETETRHKDNLESMFQTNSEKYNPKPSFLSRNALTKLENAFTKKREAAGWNPKSIKQCVLKEKGKRNNMIGKFISQKKGVDSLQNHLSRQVEECLENDRKDFKETNKKSFREYLTQKREYSLTKKNAYFASLSALNRPCSTID